MSSPPSNPRQTRRTRIVCISDTHNCTVKLPKGDVLIHAGDLTNQGSLSKVSSLCLFHATRPLERHGRCGLILTSSSLPNRSNGWRKPTLKLRLSLPVCVTSRYHGPHPLTSMKTDRHSRLLILDRKPRQGSRPGSIFRLSPASSPIFRLSSIL